MDGDGKADIIGFGSSGAYVSISSGSGFGAQALWLNQMGTGTGGWTNADTYPRCVADVNGDGIADAVGFGSSSASVARAA